MHRSLLIAGDRQDRAQTLRRTDHLAALATQSLIAEAELTPKPGLVDRRGSGAHNDLSLKLMTQSATVLEPYFAAMASCSQVRDPDTDLRMELAEIGRAAERAMFKATQGSNTHKGAIWILGLNSSPTVTSCEIDTEPLARAERQLVVSHTSLTSDLRHYAIGEQGNSSKRSAAWTHC
jgi:triphosphoribosyl-dephospho-CoA synthetase